MCCEPIDARPTTPTSFVVTLSFDGPTTQDEVDLLIFEGLRLSKYEVEYSIRPLASPMRDPRLSPL